MSDLEAVPDIQPFCVANNLGRCLCTLGWVISGESPGWGCHGNTGGTCHRDKHCCGISRCLGNLRSGCFLPDVLFYQPSPRRNLADIVVYAGVADTVYATVRQCVHTGVCPDAKFSRSFGSAGAAGTGAGSLAFARLWLDGLPSREPIELEWAAQRGFGEYFWRISDQFPVWAVAVSGNYAGSPGPVLAGLAAERPRCCVTNLGRHRQKKEQDSQMSQTTGQQRILFSKSD